MNHRYPGRGIPPHGRTPALIGGGLFLVVLFVALTGSRLGLLVLMMSGIGLGAAALQYQTVVRADHARRQLPITPRADLTARVLAALHATDEELVANQAGVMLPSQWLRIDAAAGRSRSSPLQSAAGPITITAQHTKLRSWHTLSIGTEVFPIPATLAPAMTHAAVYRVYFIDATPARWWFAPMRLILSAEALADG